MHRPDNAAASRAGSTGSSGRMSPPSHIPAVFLGYLHNPEGWKKRWILCFVPRWQLAILQPRDNGAHGLPFERPTRAETRLALGNLKAPASWRLHYAITGHATYMPRVVLLCTRACAKPQCEAGSSHRGTSLEQAPSRGAGKASSAGLETAAFASIAPTGFSPQKKQQQRPHLLKAQLQRNANTDTPRIGWGAVGKGLGWVINPTHSSSGTTELGGTQVRPTRSMHGQRETRGYKPSRGTSTGCTDSAADAGVPPRDKGLEAIPGPTP